MIKILFSQGRRFGLFSIGMALFSTALLMRFGTSWADLANLVFFLISLLGYLAVAVGLFSARPSQRGILEIAGFAAIITTIVLWYMPIYGIFPSLVGLAIFFGIMTGFWFFLGSRLSRKLAMTKSWRDSHAVLVPYPARKVWRHIVPGEAQPSDHCSGSMRSCEPAPDDPDTLHVIFGARKRKSLYELTFLEKTQPTSCRFYFQSTESDGSIVDGVYALNITVMDRDSCFVSSTEERAGLSLGGLIERWFDNPLHFQHIRLLEKLEEEYGEPGDFVSVPTS